MDGIILSFLGDKLMISRIILPDTLFRGSVTISYHIPSSEVIIIDSEFDVTKSGSFPPLRFCGRWGGGALSSGFRGQFVPDQRVTIIRTSRDLV